MSETFQPEALDDIERRVAKLPDSTLRHYLALQIAEAQVWRQNYGWAKAAKARFNAVIFVSGLGAGIILAAALLYAMATS